MRRDLGVPRRCITMREFTFHVSIQEIERLGASGVQWIGLQKPL
jgi:hypothetical protein